MDPIDASYNWFLVGLSFLVSVFGSYTALQLMRGMRTAAASSRYLWMSAAAIALGGGAIWTMHFIGMIAYHTNMTVAYDAILTFASLLVAVVMVGVGIFILSKRPDSIGFLLMAGVITGMGVASMHYTGMAAMVMAADITYDTLLFSLSLVIAVVAATAALWLAFNLESGLHIFGASIVMGIAVCGMHYTGMAAMIMAPNGAEMSVAGGMEPLTLGLFIFCFSMLLLVLSLIVTMSQLQKRMYEALADDDDEESTTAAQTA